MEGNTGYGSGQRGSRLRIVAWSAAGLLLLVPLIAMQFTDEVDWSVFDFAFMGALLVGVGVTYELTVRMTSNTSYRAAVGVALGAVFLLIWVIGAVGIIGDSGDAPDLMYGGVIAVGLIGAIFARFQPAGMARTMFAMSFAQALVALIALVAGMVPPYNGAPEILGINGFFAALFVASAGLFRNASQEQPPARAGAER